MEVIQHAQYQDPGTGSPKWTELISNVISYAYAFAAMTSKMSACRAFIKAENILMTGDPLTFLHHHVKILTCPPPISLICMW